VGVLIGWRQVDFARGEAIFKGSDEILGLLILIDLGEWGGVILPILYPNHSYTDKIIIIILNC